MDRLSQLDAHHHDQLHRVVRLFQTKRDAAVRGVQADFQDVISDRLHEEVYEKRDVLDIVTSLQDAIESNTRQELTTVLSMASLLISQAMLVAQDAGVAVLLDTAAAEERTALDAIEKLSADMARVALSKPPAKLSSIADDHKRLADDLERLESSNKALQERCRTLQSQCTEVLKEKSMLQDHVRQLELQLEGAGSKPITMTAATRRSAKDEDDDSLVATLQRANHELEEALQKRLNESPQFQSLQKILRGKNEELQELRERLRRYEPDRGAGDDIDEDI